jgi:hypothetical protein
MICNFEIRKMENDDNDSSKYYSLDKINTAKKYINLSYFKKLCMNAHMKNFTEKALFDLQFNLYYCSKLMVSFTQISNYYIFF